MARKWYEGVNSDEDVKKSGPDAYRFHSKSEMEREEIESRLENLIAARDEYVLLRNAEIADLQVLIAECDKLGVTTTKEVKPDE